MSIRQLETAHGSQVFRSAFIDLYRSFVSLPSRRTESQRLFADGDLSAGDNPRHSEESLASMACIACMKSVRALLANGL